MAITIGPVIGYAEVTNQSYVDVTVTTAVPFGDPTTAHGVVVVAVSREEYASAGPFGDSGSLVNKYPVVTDNRPPSAPYAQANRLMGTVWWTANATGMAGGDPYGASHGSVTFSLPGHNQIDYTFLGAYNYLMRAGLEVGDTVRVDYRGHEGTNVITPMPWLAVRLHRIDGLHAEHPPGPSPWYGEPFSNAFAAGLAAFSTVWPDNANPDPTGFDLGWAWGGLQFMWGYSYWTHRNEWDPTNSGQELLHFQISGEYSIDQQYIFRNDLATSGGNTTGLFIGYAFHDWESRTDATHPAVITYRGNHPNDSEPNYWGITQTSAGPGWPYISEGLHLENLI